MHPGPSNGYRSFVNRHVWSRRCAHVALAASVSAVGIGASAAAGRPLVGRRTHQVLFGATCAATVGGAALALSGRRMLPLLPLAFLPRTHAGTPAHAGAGLTAALALFAWFGP